MNTSSLRSLGLVFALATALTAQARVWIVDAANGPGTDFVDLPPAVAAAADGDVVRARPGTYSGAQIVRPLTLLGGTGVRLRVSTGFFEVARIPAGRQVTISGFDLIQPASISLDVHDCLGRVILDRIVVTTNTSTRIADCRQVELDGCRIRGGIPQWPPVAGLDVRRSTVAISGCELRGQDGAVGLGRLAGCPALGALDARVIVARSLVQGGNGGEFASIVTAPAPAIESSNSQLVVAGDAQTRIAAGTLVVTTLPVAAIVTSSGSITLDPAVTLASFGGAPLILGPATATRNWLPALTATGAAPGSSVASDLFSPAGDVVLMLVSLAADEIALGGTDSLWIDPSLFFVAAVGVQGAGQHFGLTIPVPNDPGLLFATMTQQAISGTFAGGFKLSNPASYAHD